MFRIRSLAILAALFGNASVGNAAACCSTYVAGGSYTSGDVVSATTTTTETETEDCDVGTSGCSSSGTKEVTTTTSETYNYQCTDTANSAYCSNSAYAPNGDHGSIAWDKVGTAECSGTDTSSCTSDTTPDPWSGAGCPAAYVGGTEYAEAATVSVNKGTYGLVYQCKSEPTNQYCGMAGYEPGTSQYWSTAWDQLGSCTGTHTPTSSPSYDVLSDKGSCPDAFDSGAEYEEGDKVSKGGIEGGIVFQCKSWPAGLHCSQLGYEPGTSEGTGSQTTEHWKQAWSVLGWCQGTIPPSTAPAFVALPDMGGCPDEWSQRSNVDEYEEGDLVSAGKIVYRCKAFPFSRHCGQAGYEPGVDDGRSPPAWKDAWTVAGHCSGSTGPTASPSFDVLAVGACPDEWEAGDNSKYEENDMVAITVSESPLRKVAYKCKAWPYSGYCGQFSPVVFGGSQGWSLVGGCDGSMAPTQSPSFDRLSEQTGGCPQDWSLSTDYEAGDMVALTVSTTPERKIVYKCRDWPKSGYCGQGDAYKPGTQYGYMAWDQAGYCDGTKAPTASPVAYTGDCQYSRCRMVDSTVVCTPGSTGCSCSAGQTASSSCTKDVEVEECTDTDVDAWSSSEDYLADDVVRKGLKRYKCRAWPRYFWCRQDVYKPTGADSGLWKEAWTEDGMCT